MLSEKHSTSLVKWLMIIIFNIAVHVQRAFKIVVDETVHPCYEAIYFLNLEIFKNFSLIIISLIFFK